MKVVVSPDRTAEVFLTGWGRGEGQYAGGIYFCRVARRFFKWRGKRGNASSSLSSLFIVVAVERKC